MFLTFLMLLLLIVLFLSCAALVGFTEHVISARKADVVPATVFDMALYILTASLVLVVIYLLYAVIHPERF